jgi:hypothetical protein
MLKTKLTDNFHSMRLDVSDASSNRIRITLGASIRVSSNSASARVQRDFNALAKSLLDFLSAPGPDTYGQRFAAIEAKAKASDSFASFASAIR